MKKSIVIRVDGNASIGLGHIIRSLSLALMLKDDFNILFHLRKTLQSVYNTILSNGFELVLLENDGDFFDKLTGKEIVVLDGYSFDTAYQLRVKGKGCLLVCIDDLHDTHFVSDIIINHAPGIVKKMYSAEAHTRFLLGLDYALLRPCFIKQAREKRTVRKIDEVLICFGGSDAKNITLATLQIVLQYCTLKRVIVITGSAYANSSTLLKTIQTHSAEIDHFHDLSEEQMNLCLLNAQLAIVPASGILFETIACKTPVISGYYTLNQLDIYRGFLDLDVLYGAEEFQPDNLRKALQKALSNDNQRQVENQAKCLDGKSPSRYIDVFKKLSHAHSGTS